MVLVAPTLLQPLDHTAGGAFRTHIPHRFELAVDHIGTDLAFRFLDPTLDVVDERISHRFPDRHNRDSRVQPGISRFHIPGHRVVIDTTQLPGRPERTGQIVGLKDLHNLLL